MRNKKILYNNNSLKSIFFKFLIVFSNFKRNTSTVESTKKYILWCQKRKINTKTFQKMSKIEYKNYIYYENTYKSNTSHSVLFYIHGGSFVDKPLYMQVKFAKKIAKKLHIDLVIPIYENIPNGNATLFLEEMIDIYSYLLKKYNNIYLMGDSAGGGAALSLYMLLVNKKINRPKGIILLSPWLDLSLTNKDIENKNDIVCSIVGNRYCGSIWAGALDINDYRVSPLYGNVADLNNVFITCSKNELCQPDCIKLVSKLDNEHIDYRFMQFNHQFHNFELYPIKESKIVIEEISKYMMEGY